MKIKQDLKTGQIQYQLDAGEEYNIDEHLSALSEFVSGRAVEIFRLTNNYRKLVGRLDELEAKLNFVDNKINSPTLRRPTYFGDLDDITLASIVKTYLDQKKLSEKVLTQYAKHNKVDTFSLVAVATFAHQELFTEVLIRFSRQIQIYLDS